MKRLLVLFVVMAISALAADLAGKWKANIETPNGAIESTFVFKVDGAKLTGTVTSEMMGESQISEGKVDGENVTFAVVRDFEGNQFRINYKGKISGDEIKFSIQVPNMDQSFEFTAKRMAP